MGIVSPGFWPFIAVLAFLVAGLASARSKGDTAKRRALGGALAALGAAGLGTAFLLAGGGGGVPLALFQFDALAAVMTLMITGLGAVVVRFSATYLDNDPKQPAFLGWLCLTLAAVTLLVTAGNLVTLIIGWIGTSLALHQLLVFRGDRAKAVVAARKKFLVARLGDIALVGAALVLASTFGSLEIAAIQDGASALRSAGTGSAGAGFAAGLLVLAALLKSAQFPTHGWLAEVMETPTPVSALLHAGIVNAGGFLIIRFADVILVCPPAMYALALIGGFTALFGSLVMLTQTSVKVSLAYSTVAQMGFMLLQCGLGAFSAAALHIVAHSLYKAHAFLSSGRAVIKVPGRKHSMPSASGPSVLLAVAIAVASYGLAALLFGGFAAKAPAILALGLIFIAGLALYLSGLAGSAKGLALGAAVATAASVSYFALQNAAAAILAGAVPLPAAPGAFGYAVIVLAVLSFALVALAQVLRLPVPREVMERGYVHLSRGFYANVLFGRMMGELRTRASVR